MEAIINTLSNHTSISPKAVERAAQLIWEATQTTERTDNQELLVRWFHKVLLESMFKL